MTTSRRPFGLTLRVERLSAIGPHGRGEAVVLQLGDASGERDVRLEQLRAEAQAGRGTPEGERAWREYAWRVGRPRSPQDAE